MQIKLLKHFLAALACRTEKALKDVPERFAEFDAGHGVRTPEQIIRHINEVMAFALNRIQKTEDGVEPQLNFQREVGYFYDLLEKVHTALQKHPQLETDVAQRLMQGPFADVMSHVGQIALLRRLADSPVPAENFYEAAISSDTILRSKKLQ